MGELVASSMGAPVALARALEQGRHVAMLVDQHYTRGIDVDVLRAHLQGQSPHRHAGA